MSSNDKHALVLVVGDLGHSPRMQNHVRELVDLGYSVDFVGFKESAVPIDLNHDCINIVSIPKVKLQVDWIPKSILYPFQIILKVAIEVIFLLWVGIFRLKKPQVILVQSPPVLPTLLIAPILSWWHRSRYIVDWHNVGYTLLAQNIHVPWIIALAKAIEVFFAKNAKVNLVVSKAQQQWMQINAGATSVVLYDRPNPACFCVLEKSERRTFRLQLRERLGWDSRDVPLLVSSTSWTPDEDFNILVEALSELDKSLSTPIQLLITGKGPLKEHFEDKIFALGLENIQFATAWLSFEDYALLLGSADLGICLHSSSSGIDLPMKIVDMMGAGLPVVALRFAAIGELIDDGKTGFLFNSASELAEIVYDFINGNRKCQVARLETWHEHWSKTVGPIFTS
jgi:beta-1,4-mannosyltransferase